MSWQDKFWDDIIEYKKSEKDSGESDSGESDSGESDSVEIQSKSTVVMFDTECCSDVIIKTMHNNSECEDQSSKNSSEYEINTVRSRKASKDQLKKLEAFMVGRPRFPKGREKLNQDTEKLLKDFRLFIKDLNDIGPATHTEKQWRKSWNNSQTRRKQQSQTNKKKARRDTVSRMPGGCSSKDVPNTTSDLNFNVVSSKVVSDVSDTVAASSGTRTDFDKVFYDKIDDLLHEVDSNIEQLKDAKTDLLEILEFHRK